MVEFVGGRMDDVSGWTDEIDSAVTTGQTLSLRTTPDPDTSNIIFVPIPTKEGIGGVIKAWNKRDITRKSFKPFTGEDERVLTEFAREIGRAYESLKKETVKLNSLKDLIRMYTRKMNSLPLLSTIREGAQTLLDCDRGTIFTRQGD
jgi:hypothetical protein